jgi:hypothetical protein
MSFGDAGYVFLGVAAAGQHPQIQGHFARPLINCYSRLQAGLTAPAGARRDFFFANDTEGVAVPPPPWLLVLIASFQHALVRLLSLQASRIIFFERIKACSAAAPARHASICHPTRTAPPSSPHDLLSPRYRASPSARDIAHRHSRGAAVSAMSGGCFDNSPQSLLQGGCDAVRRCSARHWLVDAMVVS